jgi:hypothetical protein
MLTSISLLSSHQYQAKSPFLSFFLSSLIPSSKSEVRLMTPLQRVSSLYAASLIPKMFLIFRKMTELVKSPVDNF